MDSRRYGVSVHFFTGPERNIAHPFELGQLLPAQAVEDFEDYQRRSLVRRVVEGRTLQAIADTAAITAQGVEKPLDRVYAGVGQDLSQAAALQ